MADINKEQLNELLNGNINDFINNNLTESQKSDLNTLLKDKAATEKLLSSPQAQEIIKKVFNKDNQGRS